jgi:uncharacterized protein (DUF433 family)
VLALSTCIWDIGGMSLASKTQRHRKAASNSAVGTRVNGALNKRVGLGRHIVADPLVCHGKPTYRGTRIMVWQILEDLARGESVDELVTAWGGRVSRAAILETIRLAGGALLDARGRLNRQFHGQLAA